MRSIFYSFIVIGLFLRFAAVFALGHHWSNYPKKPVKIVSSGIYKAFVHPAYFGTMMFFIGVILSVPSESLVWIQLFLFLLALNHSAEIEEGLKKL